MFLSVISLSWAAEIIHASLKERTWLRLNAGTSLSIRPGGGVHVPRVCPAARRRMCLQLSHTSSIHEGDRDQVQRLWRRDQLACEKKKKKASIVALEPGIAAALEELLWAAAASSIEDYLNPAHTIENPETMSRIAKQLQEGDVVVGASRCPSGQSLRRWCTLS